MNCDLAIVSTTPDADGKYRYLCTICNEPTRNRSPNVHIKRKCAGSPPPGFGPGTELEKILHGELGIADDGCKLCKAIADRMDRAGPDGVRRRRAEFAEHLRKAADKKGWGTKLTAALGSVTSGLALRIKPWDIYGSLIDEAIRRAEAANPPASLG